ncbi:cytosolic phospholipase A2 gamma-like protein [Labeo rohita]|uniref:Cytosolic phospholipase A2 gamma-like protein n=1 Tax=Labeo rohita TaxID=84645 RepID=A0A498NQK4_LABRO|nr:cytosolic phospholipase A2 gamma-like protein [Labeo rohita]
MFDPVDGMSASKLQQSGEVRISHLLNMKEKEFVVKKRETVFQSLNKLNIHCSKDAVPNIALLGSGGGQRAMVGLLGSLVQLKKIDECKLSEQRGQHSKDLFPIYTVIDKQCKQRKDDKDSWFEISPHEAGYSLTGAFVGNSSFGSQFDNGSNKKQQPEIDMLYLQASPAEKCYEVLMDLADMNLSVLNGKDPSRFDQSIRTILKDEVVPAALQESKTRDYEDAGLLLNSSYFSVLREERNTNLIISLDFSDGDPFMTVRDAAEMCKKLNIPFPKVNIPNEDVKKPKDFYVFKGKNKTPTVIHIPLFNVVNYKLETWRENYRTFQDSYSAEMIADLMEVAGKNISNNTEKLKKQIQAVVGGEVRIVHSLHTKEDKFVVERKITVVQSLQKLRIDCSKDAVPYIALLGSGGGQRAMIDECKFSEQRDQHSKDLFPIYTVIDKQRKQEEDEKDSWFEISPYEAGYSLAGAFVETSTFGSQFDNGSKKKTQDEMDMLYLQDPKAPPVEKCYQVLMDLVDMNLSVLNGKDPSHLNQSIRTNLKGEIETWRYKYRTFQGPYSAEMITDLMEVAGKNISNNREKLLEQIAAAVGQKRR